MMKNNKYKVIGLIFVIIVAVFSYLEMSYRFSGKSLAKPGALFLPDDKKIVAKGKILYQNNCASCHGINLQGEANWKNPDEDGLMPAPPHDATGHTFHHSDKLLFDIVKYGLAKVANLDDYKTNMPIYQDILSDEQIIAIMSYIKSTWPEEIRKRHDEINAKNAE